MVLNEKLAFLRKEKGLTQLQVAEKVNVSRQAVSGWETGTMVPSTGNLKCLSLLYEVPIDCLLHEDRDLSARENPVNNNQCRSHKMSRYICVFAAVAILIIAIVAVLFKQFHYGDDNEITNLESTENDKWNESQTEIELGF